MTFRLKTKIKFLLIGYLYNNINYILRMFRKQNHQEKQQIHTFIFSKNDTLLIYIYIYHYTIM